MDANTWYQLLLMFTNIIINMKPTELINIDTINIKNVETDNILLWGNKLYTIVKIDVKSRSLTILPFKNKIIRLYSEGISSLNVQTASNPPYFKK